METAPLAFGSEPETLGTRPNGPDLAPRRREKLDGVARKVIAALEPLEPASQARVLRAVYALLGLD